MITVLAYRLYNGNKLIKSTNHKEILFVAMRRNLSNRVSDTDIKKFIEVLPDIPIPNKLQLGALNVEIISLSNDEYYDEADKLKIDNHLWAGGCKDKCGECSVCVSAICKTCGLINGGLTTHCCGEVVSREVSDKVYAGKIDFRAGKWRDYQNRIMHGNPPKDLEDELKYLSELIAEGASNEYIDDALEYIVGLKLLCEDRR
jgi:hypothetical protein